MSVGNGVSTDLIAVCADDKYGGFGRVAGYRAKPEVQTSVFESLTCRPQQQVNGSLGQEKLEGKIQFCYTHTHTYIPTHILTHLHTHTFDHHSSSRVLVVCPTVTHLVSVHL